jgi:hypothetical protein
MWGTTAYPNSVIDSALNQFFAPDLGNVDDYDQQPSNNFRPSESRADVSWEVPARQVTGVPLTFSRFDLTVWKFGVDGVPDIYSGRDVFLSDDSAISNPPWDPSAYHQQVCRGNSGYNSLCSGDSDQRARNVMDSINTAAAKYAMRQRIANIPHEPSSSTSLPFEPVQILVLAYAITSPRNLNLCIKQILFSTAPLRMLLPIRGTRNGDCCICRATDHYLHVQNYQSLPLCLRTPNTTLPDLYCRRRRRHRRLRASTYGPAVLRMARNRQPTAAAALCGKRQRSRQRRRSQQLSRRGGTTGRGQWWRRGLCGREGGVRRGWNGELIRDYMRGGWGEPKEEMLSSGSEICACARVNAHLCICVCICLSVLV